MAAQIAADVFHNYLRRAEIGFSVYVKAVLMLPVTTGFDLFEGRADPGFHFIKKRSPESITEIGVIKVFNMAPEAVITETAFGDKAVDMRIPLEVTAKSMQDHDITWSKVFRFVQSLEQTRDNTADGMKEAVQEGTILQEENA